MKHFAHPTAGLPYLAQASAAHLEQLHDRIQGEMQYHMRNMRDAGILNKEPEPNVELSLDEARLIMGNLSKVAHLLRLVSEGLI